MINLNHINQAKQLHMNAAYATCSTKCPFWLNNQFLKIKKAKFSFDFNQIEHNQSFHTNEFKFTIILIVMLLVEKPCFCIMNGIEMIWISPTMQTPSTMNIILTTNIKTQERSMGRHETQHL
jgi:hypothetical protein